MSKYAEAGVDLEAGAKAVAAMKGAVEASHGPEVIAGVGAFGGLFDARALAGMKHPVLVASADGVGTKTMVAAAVGSYGSVGHDLINHCVNDILVQGARPLFFLDYIASSKLIPEQIAAVVSGAAEACTKVGCALLGGETAEMPGVYHDEEFDFVGTIVGVVEREDIIDGSDIQPGMAVIAMQSSGLHTNGFSLARKIVEGMDLTVAREELGMSIADALLVPHRCYLNEVMALLDADVQIEGLAHITGGGLIDNPPRILADNVALRIELGSWEAPPIFDFLQQHGEVSQQEMLHVFNCGTGMLAMIPQEQVDQALTIIRELGCPAWKVGDVIERTGDAVEFV